MHGCDTFIYKSQNVRLVVYTFKRIHYFMVSGSVRINKFLNLIFDSKPILESKIVFQSFSACSVVLLTNHSAAFLAGN